MMKTLLLGLSFAAPVLSQSHMHDHPPMSPRVHAAFHNVEQVCDQDVHRLCMAPEDPFLAWMMGPLMAPPPPPDFGFFLDQMMEAAISGPTLIFEVAFYEDEDMMDSSDVLDQGLQKLAAVHDDQASLAHFSKSLVDHGEEILNKRQDATEEHRHLARRLTEVTPDNFHAGKQRLPFGCPINRCLKDAYQQQVLSQECRASMDHLEHVRHMERVMAEREEVMFLGGMAILYALLVCLLLLVAFKRLNQARSNRRLKLSIFKAIYSNPALKAQVEKELGEPLGHVPPLSAFALQRMQGKATKSKTVCRLKLAFFTGLFSLIFLAPFLVLPICIVAMLVRLFQIGCSSPPVRACDCCCCGGSTEDVKNGTVSDAQACCSCCQGTGVCSVACASCCGADGCCSGCCCCGGCCDGCCCCSPGECSGCCSCCGSDAKKYVKMDDGCCTTTKTLKGRGTKHTFPAKHVLYEGVPVQIV